MLSPQSLVTAAASLGGDEYLDPRTSQVFAVNHVKQVCDPTINSLSSRRPLPSITHNCEPRRDREGVRGELVRRDACVSDRRQRRRTHQRHFKATGAPTLTPFTAMTATPAGRGRCPRSVHGLSSGCVCGETECDCVNVYVYLCVCVCVWVCMRGVEEMSTTV